MRVEILTTKVIKSIQVQNSIEENIMAKKKHHKNNQGVAYMEVEKGFGMWENYMQYGSQYDTVNDCPLIPGETGMVEQLSFKKLSVDTKKLLRTAMVDLVLNYWQKERMIPEGSTVKEFRNVAIKEVYYISGQYAKDSDELKHMLNECIIPTINKELRKEKSTVQIEI